jgi:hypothetical protein
MAATVTPTAPTTADPSIYVLANLAACVSVPASCLAGADTGLDLDPESLKYNNTTGAPITVFLVVDTYDTNKGMTYNLTVTIDAIPPAPTNDTCQTAAAITITGGIGMVTGDTSSANNSNVMTTADGGTAGSPSCTSTGRTTGLDVIYTYTLAAAQDVTLTATPSTGSTLQPIIYVRKPAACESVLLSDEVACDLQVSVVPSVVRIFNQPAGTYFVWLDSAQGSSGAFTLTVQTGAPTLPPTNDTCSAPIDIVFPTDGGSATFTATNGGGINNYHGTCANGSQGKDSVWKLTLAAPKSVTITAYSDGGDPVIYLGTTPCEATDGGYSPVPNGVSGDGGVASSCVDDGFKNDPETIKLNPLAAGTYYLFVDDYYATSPGVFNVTVTAQ